MKIKNYDRREKNHNDKKLNDILSEDYRMLISGPSNCGKTNTLMHILREHLFTMINVIFTHLILNKIKFRILYNL